MTRRRYSRPFAARGRYRPRRRAGSGRRLVYGLVWLGLGLGAAALAPVVDDLRSDLRPMQPGCRVLRVVDGDTLDLSCAGAAPIRARLTGYDAPELFSPACAAEARAAEAAKGALARITGTGPLEAALLGTDRYDRTLVDLRVGGERIASTMVAQGHGRRYLGGLRGGWC